MIRGGDDALQPGTMMATASKQPTVSNAVLGTILSGLKDEVSDMKQAMTKMASAMSTLAAVEQRQSDQTARMTDAFTILTKQSDRIAVIEVDMPGLREMRKLVWMGLVAGVGMMFVAVFSLVLRQPVTQYVNTTPPAVIQPAAPAPVIPAQ